MTSQAPIAVLAGASGFIGSDLARRLLASGYRVRLIGRAGPDARWGDPAAILRAVDGADLLINLAGKSVNCRYTAANRAEIFRSRVETTRELSDAVAAAEHPPALWLNSSTATIYRHADDRAQTEADGEIGSGFSVDVARAWEREFFRAELPATRRVALRLSIVLGDGPATAMLVNLARFGLGGAQIDGPWIGGAGRRIAGTWHENRRTRGNQRFSWVHIDDVWRVILFLRDHTEIDGVVNVAAPEASDNRTLMQRLTWAAGLPVGLPAYRWMLEPAMFVLRTESELVLKSRWVAPERLLQAGFRFEYADLDRAVAAVSG